MSALIWIILMVVCYALTIFCLSGKAIAENRSQKWTTVFWVGVIIFGSLMLAIMCVLLGGIHGVVIPIR